MRVGPQPPVGIEVRGEHQRRLGHAAQEAGHRMLSTADPSSLPSSKTLLPSSSSRLKWTCMPLPERVP